MQISVRIKYWFFDHYWWLLCGAMGFALAILLVLKEPLPTIATALGALLSLAYFLQKQKLDELRLFREIFKECNARYDELNEDLARIASSSNPELTTDDRQILIDYFNLCGEEYLYFRRGYIDPSVWRAWHNGMQSLVLLPSINTLWKSEKATGSYYDLDL